MLAFQSHRGAFAKSAVSAFTLLPVCLWGAEWHAVLSLLTLQLRIMGSGLFHGVALLHPLAKTPVIPATY